MKLLEVIYVSNAAPSLSDDDIREIVESSYRRNVLRNITGIMLYSRRRFLQVLEGEESVVEHTLARSLEDARHHGIQILAKSAIAERIFIGWSIGIRDLHAPDAPTWPGYVSFFAQGFDAESITARPGPALDILKAFSEET
jgi:hypothetical protein